VPRAGFEPAAYSLGGHQSGVKEGYARSRSGTTALQIGSLLRLARHRSEPLIPTRCTRFVPAASRAVCDRALRRWLSGAFVQSGQILVVDVELAALTAGDLPQYAGLLKASNRRVDGGIAQLERFRGRGWPEYDES
jgi:hypothetical protein